MKKDRARPGDKTEDKALPVATAMVCGALVMVIEILGSRAIGPFLGASHFAWTSPISATLVV
ncbi:MAG: hypothetical protein HGB21_12375 [Nitrospirae bacterium]|nr:hypothetical protein [Nitrospirota bacterium]NTW67082.1 hypothetical protein [Nitrospirota bacterium]